jgi:glycine/D-amino acid oxidase-like deaminating enzyme
VEPVWDDGDWAGLPTLQGEHRADVCVIGLGASGLAAVLEALGREASVVGVDAGPVAAGAAGRNGGFLLAGLPDAYHRSVVRLGRPRAAALYRLTLDELDRIEEAMPDLVRRRGSLRLATSPEEEADCDEHRAELNSDGFQARAYEGPEGRGVLLPDDGATNPLARARRLATTALAVGAQLYERSPVTALTGSEVTAAGGRVRCSRVVVAVDGGLEVLLPELADRVRTARLQMLATAPTDEVAVPRPVYARWGNDYWQQLPDGRIALGGQRDRFVDDEWTTNGTPTDQVQAALEQILRRQLRVTAPVTHRWAASAGFTADVAPVLDEVRPHVFAVGGYSGTGNVLGSIYGRAAAQLAVTGRSDLADLLRAS